MLEQLTEEWKNVTEGDVKMYNKMRAMVMEERTNGFIAQKIEYLETSSVLDDLIIR